MMPSFKITASIFPEISFIQYFPLFSCKQYELIHVSNALKSNGYPSTTITNILKKKSTSEVIPSPEEFVGMFLKWTDPPDS